MTVRQMLSLVALICAVVALVPFTFNFPVLALAVLLLAIANLVS